MCMALVLGLQRHQGLRNHVVVITHRLLWHLGVLNRCSSRFHQRSSAADCSKCVRALLKN
jgi:hypothetical protein